MLSPNYTLHATFEKPRLKRLNHATIASVTYYASGWGPHRWARLAGTSGEWFEASLGLNVEQLCFLSA